MKANEDFLIVNVGTVSICISLLHVRKGLVEVQTGILVVVSNVDNVIVKILVETGNIRVCRVVKNPDGVTNGGLGGRGIRRGI